jgi:hypothetical protein
VVGVEEESARSTTFYATQFLAYPVRIYGVEKLVRHTNCASHAENSCLTLEQAHQEGPPNVGFGTEDFFENFSEKSFVSFCCSQSTLLLPLRTSKNVTVRSRCGVSGGNRCLNRRHEVSIVLHAFWFWTFPPLPPLFLFIPFHIFFPFVPNNPVAIFVQTRLPLF